MEKKQNREQALRYERKFIVPDELKRNIDYMIAMHPAIFTEIYHQRCVNNIYFDSIEYNCYHENISGIANRKKIRLRWYGELYGTIQGVLEVKVKNGTTGYKQSFPLPSFHFTDQTNISDIKELLIGARIPEYIRQELFTLDMSLLNCYSRRYFLSLDQHFRITLDSQLKYFRVDNNANNSESFMTKDYSMILELKYAKEKDVYADYISNKFPFRITRNSKYIIGINYIRV